MMSTFPKMTLFLAGLFAISLAGCAASDDGPETDVCEGVTCSGFGACVAEDGHAACLCENGYHPADLECKADLCLPSTCINGFCTDAAYSPDCTCEKGYTGDRCGECTEGYHVVDLKCVPVGSSTCSEATCIHGECVATGDGGAECRCFDGWTGENCTECAEKYHDENGDCVPDSPCNPDPCVHGTCAEDQGRAVCACLEGYEGQYCNVCARGYIPDGLECVPENPDDPCTPSPCLNADNVAAHRTRCVNDDGDAVCRCDAGWHEDGDACAEDTVCDPLTTCSGNGVCTGNGLECECDAAYDGAHCDACANAYVWEGGICVPDATNPCFGVTCGEPNRSVCTPDGESYACACDEGHRDVAGVCVADCDVDATSCAFANPSFGRLVSANGHGAVVLDLDGRKADGLFEHPYKTWGVNGASKTAHTRNLLFDAYFGLRTDGDGVWLSGEDLDYAGYYDQDGIPLLVQQIGDIRVESYIYAPYGIERPALVMLAHATNMGSVSREVSIYSLHNYHVGRTTDTDTETGVSPDAADERIRRDGDTGAYVESGPGGVLVHRPLGGVSHVGAGSSGAANPYDRLLAGEDLGGENDTGVGDDRVCGFQKDLTLAPGESGWLGVATAFDRGGDAEAVQTEFENHFGETEPEAVLAAAVAEWDGWRAPLPTGLSHAETWVYRTSEAVLRMGQVLETTDHSHGQILASLPPGIWAISWVRDMSYSIRALIRSGHNEEARAALSFMLEADTGDYTEEVGLDYQISVCRFFGNGMEESDHDRYGPNVEFDGFGLFLWVLGEYVRATGDTSLLDAHWAAIRDRIAGALVNLTAENGMILPDSSIWETHWEGQNDQGQFVVTRRQFTYTSLAAVRGLCEAADLAVDRSDLTNANAYRQAAEDILQGIRDNAMSGSFLVQSVEEFQSGSGYLDAAVADAFNWLLFDPEGSEAVATVAEFNVGLKAAHGRGYFRNDDGGEYDSKEWVFVDMRIASALRRGGAHDRADALVDWITAQAMANMGLIAELHHPSTAAYDGAIPMVGFGAGAYMLNLWQREEPQTESLPCGWDAWSR